MLLYRMAPRPLLFLTLWTTATTLAAAGQINITSEIANFVPPCAQSCLRSFAANNFQEGDCGDQPTLQCLCRHTGASGYTIGEGAVQCIISENGQGVCSDSDVGDASQAINTAYNMCVGISSAAPETHSTIVATYVSPSGTGAASASTSSTTHASRISAVPTSTAATTAANTATPVPPAPIPATETNVANSTSPGLPTAAIVGIVVGSVAILFLGVALILLARCARRRRFGDQESGFFKIKDAKSRNGSPHMQISGPNYKTPVEMEFGFSRPGDFTTPIVRPEAIGLAISPGDMATERRSAQAAPKQNITPAIVQGRSLTNPRQQNFAPAIIPQPVQSPIKPVLTLNIPKEERQLPPLPPPPPRGFAGNVTSRDSVVTEFAEDEEAENGASAQIWRPPPSDPQSATTYYVADKWGNWVLGHTNEKPAPPKPVEMASPTDKTKAEKAQDELEAKKAAELAKSAMLAVPGANKPTPKLGSPIRFRDQAPAPRATSSVYSTISVPQSIVPGPLNPLPPPKAELNLAGARENRQTNGGSAAAAGNRASTKPRRKPSRRSRASERRRSQDSATTIEDGLSDDDFDDGATQMDLSPVAESPGPASGGISPVAYPKITPLQRDARLSPTLNKAVKVPAPLSVFPSKTPPPQIPPTAAEVMLKYEAYRPGAKGLPPRSATLNPNPNLNPAQVRTGSPETRLGPSTAASIGARAAQDQARQQRQLQDVPRPRPEAYTSPRMATSTQQRRMPPPALAQGQGREQVYQQPPVPQEARRPSPGTTLSPRLQTQGQQPTQWHPSQSPVSPTQLPSPQSPQQPQQGRRPSPSTPQQQSPLGAPHVANLASSSLLAKRVGQDRAAAFMLGGSSGTPKKPQPKWMREQQEGDLGSQLPMTPGWLPRLTPTRRGDDLFLNVQ
ncbi:hypothetical protein GQ53DRAFT_106307 [Thozetella sp. PMI_491]|nr:hypothetical protein GQ53DRAFT_106307 [Thozetella sp. PMI_491]